MSETCRGETTERTWFHCYALWLYTGQVESLSSSSENNLFPQKNWHVLYFVIALHQEKGLQMNEDTVATWHQLWYSHFLWARSSDKAEQENTLTKSRLIVGLRPSPPAWHPPIYAAPLVLGQFFLMIDSDRAEQSFTVPACLPAAASGVHLM